MAVYHLEPDRPNLHGQFSALLDPVLTVESGDTIQCRTLDVAWGLEGRKPDTPWRRTVQPRESPRDDGPCLLGPIAVRGARPGHVLEVHLEDIVPGMYGWTFAGEIGFFNTSLNRTLGVAEGDPFLLRWELDAASRTGISHLGHRIRLSPFMGTLGLCPAGEGWISAWPPRRTLGNTDCRALTAGSVLYIPVEVPGVLLSLGDGHAAQGDGESSGTALECPMDRVTIRVVLREDLNYPQPRARTPEGWVTFGFSESLDDAIGQALNAMLDLVQEERGVSRKVALALTGAAADVRITQLVNGVRGVHVVFPHQAIEFEHE